MKLVINGCYGGFSVSPAVLEFLGLENVYGILSNRDFDIEGSRDYYAFRSHPKLIEAIELIGEEASSGRYANLRIIEIPDGIDYSIAEYDGKEWVEESHRTWS